MHMAAKTLLDGCHEFLDDFQQHFWRRTVAFFSDLVDRFFRADPCIRQQIVHSAVSPCVSGFLIAGCLPGQIIAVALLVEIPLHLIEGWILTGLIFLVIPQTVLSVPVKVQTGTILVDVLRMGYIELAVIVFGVIDAVLSCAAIVTGDTRFLICHAPHLRFFIMW